MLSFRNARSSAWLAAAMLLGGVVLAIPRTGSAANLETVAVSSRTAQAKPSAVESRINTLHQELHITPEQEAAWKNVAQAMRDNATAMAELRGQQAKSEQTATAPDMINAYGKTTDAHADAIKKFAAVFDPLYDGMSAAQKKTADTVFRRRVKDAANRQTGSKS
jgi:hypothetical protein